jgi:L-iditol 2-dehydrogenase
MKALRLHAVKDLRVDDLPEPQAGHGQVKVKVMAVGLCGSDVHYYTHGRIGDQVLKAPMIQGHEGAGVVAEVGPGVTGLAVGRRVAIEPARPCGRCEWCETGRPNLCPKVVFCSTPPNDGLMAEFAVMAAYQCVPIPDDLSFDEAAMLEPLQVSIHAMNLARDAMRAGATVAVVGSGSIGLGCLQMAKVSGAARVIATDRFDYRLDLARRLGATDTVNVEHADPVHAVMDLTGGRGADLVFECSNRAGGTPQAYGIAAIGGAVVLVGIPEEDEILVDTHVARRKELAVRYVRRSRFAMRQALTLVTGGMVNVKPWVTHRMPLADSPKAFEMVTRYSDGIVKAVILPNG